MWPSLSAPQRNKLAVRYYNPLRKAVDGAWSSSRPQRPMGWREVPVLAQRPTFEVALAASRVRFLARIRHAPAALAGLLQVAGAEWRPLLIVDLSDMQSVLKPLLDQHSHPHAW